MNKLEKLFDILEGGKSRKSKSKSKNRKKKSNPDPVSSKDKGYIDVTWNEVWKAQGTQKSFDAQIKRIGNVEKAEEFVYKMHHKAVNTLFSSGYTQVGEIPEMELTQYVHDRL